MAMYIVKYSALLRQHIYTVRHFCCHHVAALSRTIPKKAKELTPRLTQRAEVRSFAPGENASLGRYIVPTGWSPVNNEGEPPMDRAQAILDKLTSNINKVTEKVMFMCSCIQTLEQLRIFMEHYVFVVCVDSTGDVELFIEAMLQAGADPTMVKRFIKDVEKYDINLATCYPEITGVISSYLKTAWSFKRESVAAFSGAQVYSRHILHANVASVIRRQLQKSNTIPKENTEILLAFLDNVIASRAQKSRAGLARINTLCKDSEFSWAQVKQSAEKMIDADYWFFSGITIEVERCRSSKQ